MPVSTLMLRSATKLQFIHMRCLHFTGVLACQASCRKPADVHGGSVIHCHQNYMVRTCALVCCSFPVPLSSMAPNYVPPTQHEPASQPASLSMICSCSDAANGAGSRSLEPTTSPGSSQQAAARRISTTAPHEHWCVHATHYTLAPLPGSTPSDVFALHHTWSAGVELPDAVTGRSSDHVLRGHVRWQDLHHAGH
jgi:hypothetical protein